MRTAVRENPFLPALAFISMGFFFSYWDASIQAVTNYTFMDSFFPWVMMASLFFVPSILIVHGRLLIGFANALLGLITEDLLFWLWRGTVPHSWGSFYIVFHGIPLNDITGIIIVCVCYAIELRGMPFKGRLYI